MTKLITICKALFVTITLLVAIPAAITLRVGVSGTVGMFWITLFVGCIGVITTWREKE